MSETRTGTSNRRDVYADSVYVEGNTVRAGSAVPQRNPQEPRRRPEPPAKTQEQIRAENARRRAAHRNLERALAVNRGYVAFLTLATVVCFVVCLVFIYLQSNITQNMSAISALETELSDQKAANDLAESHLETSMTINEVKDRAQEMGLVYPSTSQIEYYSVENSDYMNQYTDVASK